jgi:ureidoglycolate hydrolase
VRMSTQERGSMMVPVVAYAMSKLTRRPPTISVLQIHPMSSQTRAPREISKPFLERLARTGIGVGKSRDIPLS